MATSTESATIPDLEKATSTTPDDNASTHNMERQRTVKNHAESDWATDPGNPRNWSALWKAYHVLPPALNAFSA
jgi:hypothetical protein